MPRPTTTSVIELQSAPPTSLDVTWVSLCCLTFSPQVGNFLPPNFLGGTATPSGYRDKKVKVKERIVLSEIHLRTTGRHLSMGSHSIICHPTDR